ncbi:putative NnrU family protein [Candidatus Terasakiella magnetica]|uniref:Putative NnrU family protein n=1 Tax=Candidatus Terasakiella magnetica TaxID=1867952 RepID=A0A1C3REH4_9PROT|nr:NnrU family protein [Candidatus Terasakiella magnetica]SCA55687.1 putative NnrU family protein [Candidatus Terasakiella magnetica]
MSDLLLAIAVFIAAHIIPSYRPLRQGLVEMMGEKLFMSIYGIISLALFIWLLQSYLAAPYQELWVIQSWMRHVVLFVMFWVCLLLVCTFSQPNPFSLGLGAKGFDQQHPGIVGLTKHPAFVAFALWAFVHILPNGDVASVLFFALMGALSLYGPMSLNAKRKARMGQEEWHRLEAEVAKSWPKIGLRRWLVAAVLYAGLVLAHEPVIGVMPYSW